MIKNDPAFTTGRYLNEYALFSTRLIENNLASNIGYAMSYILLLNIAIQFKMLYYIFLGEIYGYCKDF